jgi:hypothetical protein
MGGERLTRWTPQNHVNGPITDAFPHVGSRVFEKVGVLSAICTEVGCIRLDRSEVEVNTKR